MVSSFRTTSRPHSLTREGLAAFFFCSSAPILRKPMVSPDEAAMIDVVCCKPSALGWLGQEPSDKLLRTVLLVGQSL